MADTRLTGALRRLHVWGQAQTLVEAPDAELLERFTAGREEAAFAALLRRHGPMVLGVSRRVLGREQDAEDVFQATFLVLARKAGSVRKRASVGSFLHGVAHRLALKARAQGMRRQARERQAADMRSNKTDVEAAWQEVQATLDTALSELPEHYRSALVLCYLEGKSHAEAATLLGCPLATVRTRIARGRKLLRGRLAGKGLPLSAVALGALLVAGTPPAAAPAALARATLKAAQPFAAGQPAGTLCSGSVAGLVEGGLKAMSRGKTTFALVLLLVAGLLAGAAVLAATQPPAAEPPLPPQKAPAARAADNGEVEVTGRVLDPEGKPRANARLYWPRLLREQPESLDDVTWDRRAVTAADGTFRLKLARKDFPKNLRYYLVAAAEGCGVDWIEVGPEDSPAEKTFRLAKDVLIRGRLLDTQGKPLAGARLRIIDIGEPEGGKLDSFLEAWKRDWRDAERLGLKRHLYGPLNNVLPLATTDKEGRFEITGAGAERLVQLEVDGPTARATLHVLCRRDLDVRPINAAALDRIPEELRIPGQPPLLYGPTFDYVAGPARIVEGTVRESGTGKPLAGVRLSALGDHGAGAMAVSDAQGRFTLAGLPKRKYYDVHAEPPADSSLLELMTRTSDNGGLGPIKVDVELARGVVVSGRLIDRATGKGVKGGIRYAPLPDNKYFGKKPGCDSYRYERFTHDVDSQGRFRLIVLPGAGVLLAQAYGSEKVNGVAINPYLQAEFEGGDRQRIPVTVNEDNRSFTAAGTSVEFLSSSNAVKVLDLAEEAGPTACDLYVERGRTLMVHILDPDGKRLSGVTVSGVTASWPKTATLAGADCMVYALDLKKPRQLLFLHPERKLAGALTVRGDENEPPTARLRPTGAVAGRVLDQDGQPMAAAEVRLFYSQQVGSELVRHLQQKLPPVRTDKDGRFRLEALVPDVKFGLGIYQGKTFLVGEPRIGQREVKSAATLDLGDVRTRPAQ